MSSSTPSASSLVLFVNLAALTCPRANIAHPPQSNALSTPIQLAHLNCTSSTLIALENLKKKLIKFFLSIQGCEVTQRTVSLFESAGFRLRKLFENNFFASLPRVGLRFLVFLAFFLFLFFCSLTRISATPARSPTHRPTPTHPCINTLRVTHTHTYTHTSAR